MMRLGPPSCPGKPASAVGLLALCAALGGCGDGIGWIGPMLRISGPFNGWAKGDHAPVLRWEGGVYRGEVELPGEALELRLYSPYVDLLVGAPGTATSVFAVPAALQVMAADSTGPLRVSTPLPALYEVEYRPAEGLLRVDLAAGAAAGRDRATQALITALRGSDRLSMEEKVERARQLRRDLDDLGASMPLSASLGKLSGLTFLYAAGPLGPRGVSLIGDFNGWDAAQNPMQRVLDGSVAYLGMSARAVRLEYRLAIGAERQRDPRNPEVAWDGAYLPENLSNILGGNLGELNSVARAPGYVDEGSRLLLLTLGEREVLVYLPPGYDEGREDYPTLYVHDGKDAIVRGQYHRVLDRLIKSRSIPKVVAVFVQARSDAMERLAEYSSYKDPYFPEITPRGDRYEGFILDQLLPAIEARFRVKRSAEHRAMLGVDMGGALTFHLAWTDPKSRIGRVASQSGRFGWGARADSSPYSELLLRERRAEVLRRVSFDWAVGDHFQVEIHDSIIMPGFKALGGYTTRFTRQPSMLPRPATLWDNWRSRLDITLPFLLGDLPTDPTG